MYYDIELTQAELEHLPRGWEAGAHWSCPDIGISGYWVYPSRSRTGLRAVRARVTPERYRRPVRELREALEAAASATDA